MRSARLNCRSVGTVSRRPVICRLDLAAKLQSQYRFRRMPAERFQGRTEMNTPDEDDRNEMYEQIARDFYPDHKAQAITEFTRDRLQSYYVANPRVMRPAVDAIQEGRRLRSNGHAGAAVVYFVTAIELLLKATLLKPVVHGLVHMDGLAEVIVGQALGQAGFDRYVNLLKTLFADLAGMDIAEVRRPLVSKSLLEECTQQQKLRNQIIHQGSRADIEQAESAQLVAVAVYELVVQPMLSALGLWVIEHGEIRVYGTGFAASNA